MATDIVSSNSRTELAPYIKAHIATAHRLRQLKAEISVDGGHRYNEIRALELVRSGEVTRAGMQTTVATLTTAIYTPSPPVSLLAVLVERMTSLPRANVDLVAWARHTVELLSEEEVDEDSAEAWYDVAGGFSAAIVHVAATNILASERWLPPPAAVLEACKAVRLALIHDLSVARYFEKLAAKTDPDAPGVWDLD
ncbi:hypothetical protein [uncultured Alsobacter sp.]|uniref:hypothetical protein n=1 Tax=uncultured Alsobacter sp. TaxID=1748258 RepID=UPI0025F657D5|nr:hypothetical protein [uncultured Alsobacter sp.]